MNESNQAAATPNLKNSSKVPDAVVTDRRLASYDAEADAGSPTSPQLMPRRDPFNFGHGLKTDAEIAELRSRKRGKRLATYHRKQNTLIAYLLKPMEEHTEDARNEEDLSRLPVKTAVRASLVANIALAVLQLYAAVSSASLSLLATGIDSVFDVGSNFLLYYINHKSSRMDVNKWPVGGARLETIGNVIYGTMGSVNFIVIIESARDLITHKNQDLNDFHIPSVVAVGAALGVKFLLFLYCYSLRLKSSQVMVLWEDHRNDLFINSFGLLMSAGGSKLAWYLDPIGAIIASDISHLNLLTLICAQIALGVIVAWTRTVYTQFELLAGKSAPHDFIQLIIYKAMTFSDEIERIDTVRAYHDYFVEVDVVMDANTPLWKAHDISQQLQDKIEILPNVGRAFVHVDHETTHTPEHRKYI
ncbi:CDF-like metal transporter [Lactarius akahatsu]|uniref:CDF-like metal transporter n=1 Tax=Lactarius akahatsu TaxID=416441 RepID=A0AAD4QDR3_9AGAM|nr:CDF-like metal transporter [Lactarius akahatsu]